MASFLPFVGAGGVRRNGPDVVAALPDPPRGPDEPVIRPDAPRYAGAPLVWLPLVAQGGPTFPFLAPLDLLCRRLPVAPALPALPGVDRILELSPLPFAAGAVLRRLPGIPTFYVGLLAGATVPEQDELVRVGDPVVTVGAAWVGLLFADRVALAPAGWVEQIALAMTGIDSAADVNVWRALARFADPARTLYVRDHVGRPAAGQPIGITSPAGTTTVTTDADGTLTLPAGDLRLRWTAAAPVHARYEAGRADQFDRTSSTPPGVPLAVPAAVTRAHLQLLDADLWFAARPPQLDPGLGHVHPDSRLEPLVDGIASFQALLADLRAATGPGDGAHFAGWAFNDFPLDPADPEQTMFVDLVKALRGGGTQDALGSRFLMDKYLVFRPDAPTDELNRIVALLLLAATEGLLIASVIKELKFDDAGFLVLEGLTVLGIALAVLIGVDPLLGKLEDAIDGSEELAAVLNAITPDIALRARHPSRFVDNALTVLNPLPLDPSMFIDGVGSYHQKFQVIRRTPDALGNRVIGYVGGIDINRNRLDTPGHHGRAWRPPEQVSPTPSAAAFHDVHARITGPAAADVALTFDRRWAFDVSRQPARPAGSPPQLPLAFATPDPDASTEVPSQPARHLVQVGRTGYRPAEGAGSPPLPWSPLGEATIPEAMINAIDQAREYIYIEDQYFTPPDSYVHALLAAAARTPQLRLLIVVPTASDQVFGDIRRREIFAVLRQGTGTQPGWGDRMIVGALVRRPLLADAGRVASKGRLLLLEPLGPVGGDVVVTLGPRSRLPGGAPFWLWIEGERMLAAEQREEATVDAIPARRYLIRRPSGTAPLWGARTREHAVGAPVTLSQVRGIYVHTKAIVVDDVFVGIGSCNANRRGYFHDGEITAFAVPEALKAAADNPARALRTALWAEHLGLPPAMGEALLADPIAAFELFRRPTLTGNRVSPFEALGITPELGFPGEKGTVVKMLAAFGLTVAEDLVPYVWNVLADPPTAVEGSSQVGPPLGAGV